MAIPTQFSVTSTIKNHISNPDVTITSPVAGDAVTECVIDSAGMISPLNIGEYHSASLIAPESHGQLDTPSSAVSESQVSIPAPLAASSLPAGDISTPSEATSEAQPSIDTPTSTPAISQPAIDTPTATAPEVQPSIDLPLVGAPVNHGAIDTPANATPEAQPSLDLPTAATGESQPVITLPTAKAAQEQPAITLPLGVTPESQSAIPTPSIKTPEPQPPVEAPSVATTVPQSSISAPSSVTAESAASIGAPSSATAESAASVSPSSVIPAQDYGKNLLTYSEQFDNSAWIKSRSSVTANQTIAPDGTLTADAMFDSTDTNYHSTFQFKDVTAGETYTLSFYAKSGTLTQAGAQFGGAQFGACECLIDLIKGSVLVETGCTVSVRRAGEWYRVSTTATATATGISAFGIISGKNGNAFYTGTGTDFFYVWGAQLEDSLTANDYKKTEATPITAEIQSPSVASSESSVVVATPSSLTANPRTATTPPFPLNHARILANNILKNYSTITATNAAAGFPVTNALTANTGQTWRFTTSASTMQLDFGGGTEQIDMLCIGGHNLGRAGATVEVYYEPEPGGTLVQFGDTKNLTFTQNDALCFYSETILEALSIEVRITGVSGVPQISYISGGVALQMQRPFFNGHVPITDADVTEFYNPRTESGNIRSRLVRRQGYKTSYDFNNIDDAWYRAYFAPVKELLKTEVIFTAWNLLEYPDDIGFGLVEGDINTSMQNGFGTKRNGLSFTLLGY